PAAPPGVSAPLTAGPCGAQPRALQGSAASSSPPFRTFRRSAGTSSLHAPAGRLNLPPLVLVIFPSPIVPKEPDGFLHRFFRPYGRHLYHPPSLAYFRARTAWTTASTNMANDSGTWIRSQV